MSLRLFCDKADIYWFPLLIIPSEERLSSGADQMCYYLIYKKTELISTHILLIL